MLLCVFYLLAAWYIYIHIHILYMWLCDLMLLAMYRIYEWLVFKTLSYAFKSHSVYVFLVCLVSWHRNLRASPGIRLTHVYNDCVIFASAGCIQPVLFRVDWTAHIPVCDIWYNPIVHLLECRLWLWPAPWGLPHNRATLELARKFDWSLL